MRGLVPTALMLYLTQLIDPSISPRRTSPRSCSPPRSVSRWIAGDVEPQPLHLQRLIELAHVGELVTEVMRPDDAHFWLMSPNRLLGHDSPADRIRGGDYRSVPALLDALADGITA